MRLRALSFVMATASLLLCLATAALWVRSHVVADQLSKSSPGRYVAINSDRGTLAYVVGNDTTPVTGRPAWRWYKAYGGTFGGGYDAAVGSSDNGWTSFGTAYTQRAWWVHHWVIVLATAVAPAARFATWWPGRRAARRRDRDRAPGARQFRIARGARPCRQAP